MTVCVAALCRWNYNPFKSSDDWGTVAITASDRMITFGDVQYEPSQTKVAEMSQHTMLLIAGDYALHSEAIIRTREGLARQPAAPPRDIALAYGRQIQAIKRRHAEDMYLAPLGLNTDLLMAQQREMTEHSMSFLMQQMQEYRGEDVEALIVGTHEGHATIYHIDGRGSVTCMDDVGFAAIGSGAWHTRSLLMQNRYSNAWLFFPALALVFAAKRAADLSPGVGRETDIHIAYKTGTERLVEATHKKLQELYQEFVDARSALVENSVKSLIDFVLRSGATSHEQDKGQPPDDDKKIDGSSGSPTTEAAKKNEDRKD